MNVNYYLHVANSHKKTSIMLHVTHNRQKLIYSTGQKVMPSEWNKSKQRLKTSSNQALSLNLFLNKVEDEVLSCFRAGVLDLKFDFKQSVKEHLNSLIRGVKTSDEIEEVIYESFIEYLKLMIDESEAGIRLQKDGKRIAKDTFRSYTTLEHHLVQYQIITNDIIKLKRHKKSTSTERKQYSNHWKLWYNRFTDYLYNDCRLFDNSVGSVVKTFKTLWNYIKDDKCQDIGSYNKGFHCPKENVQVITLNKGKLLRLINDKAKYETLGVKLKVARDCFVFGCSVGLRIKDLKALTIDNLQVVEGQTYLNNISSKTNTETIVKLPSYCLEILDRYSEEGRLLLPICAEQNFNMHIKEICKHYGFDEEVVKYREKRGVKVKVPFDEKLGTNFKFYQLVSTHCMRRTFVTTMLEMEVPERIVKTLSGHSASSKSFSQYIEYNQRQNDNAIDVVFNKLIN